MYRPDCSGGHISELADEPARQVSAVAEGGADIVGNRGTAPPDPPAEERHVAVEARAIDLDPMATLHDVELGDHPGGVMGGVPLVGCVADEGR